MFDKKVCDLLASWGFADTIPHFYRLCIDHDVLLQLPLDPPDPLIEELFPLQERREDFVNKLHLYQGITLDKIPIVIQKEQESTAEAITTKRHTTSQEASEVSKKLRSKNADCDLLITENTQLEIFHENVFSNFHSLNLIHLLNQTFTGQKILAKYRDKILPRNIRKILVDLIIRSLLEIPSLSTHGELQVPELKNYHFEILTNKLCDVFTKETPETYFIPPKTENKNQTISRGKLVDKYRNWRTAQKELGLIESKNSEVESEEKNCTSADNSPNEHIVWLLNNNAPWRNVINHWQLSVEVRLREFQYNVGSVKEIFDKYSVLKQPCGYELIESVFMYEKGREGMLYATWPELSNKLHDLMKIEIKDNAAKELLETLSFPTVSEEERNLKLLLLLPALCPPVCKIKKSKTIWKPTIEEAQASFILHVKTPGDIDKALTGMRDKYANFGVQLQPLIIAVGPTLSEVTGYYVNIDDTRYRFPSILAAVDLCFKSFHVLHAKYPKPSEPIWLFIQKIVYSFTTPWDKKLPCVATLVSTVQNM
ncbi:uncharacterized protein [Linepithema humile]|uniref:uncharacterized protein isoform X2 n=1 Tax=Linepithema humile TaxID=83485 RepID=UPI00351E985A